MMKPDFRLLALSLGAALVLTACGGGGSGATDDWTGGSDTNMSAPSANAGSAQSVLVGATVTLNGNGSSTSSGGLSYAWTLVSKPEGSAAQLTRADTVNPTFVADVTGRYEIDLVVSNGQASSSHSRVIVTAGSTEPIADGPLTVVNALVNGWAQLDGSRSTPPAGGDELGMLYTWTVTDPDDTAVQLYDAYSAKPGFVPTKTGMYLAKLVVSYGRKTSNEFVISINVTRANSQPVANAGGPYTGVTGQGVALNASASTDADGDALTYTWRLAPYLGNGPATAYANARIDNAATANPTFSADIAGTYRLDLYAFDGTSRSQSARAEITLSKPAGGPNTAPVARIRDYYPLNEAEPLSSSSTSAAYVYFYSDSYDKEGDALTYKWEWGDTPAGFYRPDLSTYGNRNIVSFRPNNTGQSAGTPLEGNYTIYLTVNDGQADSQRISQTVTVRTGANRRPSAVVTADTDTVMVGTEAWFDGTKSQDPDDGTFGLTYQWRWSMRPAGSNAQLQHATSSRASFVPDVPGAYEAELIVSDSVGTPSRMSEWTDYPKTATVMVKSRNNAPVARFVSANPGQLDESQGIYHYTLLKDGGASLDGLGCSFTNLDNNTTKLAWGNTRYHGQVEELAIKATALDPDGDSLYYHLSVASPAGSGLQSSYSDKVINNAIDLKICNLDVPGDYNFTLQVSDGSETTDVQRLIVRVAQPSADATALKLETLTGSTATDSEQVFGEQDPTAFNYVNRLDKPKMSASYGPSNNDNTTRKALYEQFRNGGTLKYLRLTAIGKDYAISDVQASVSQYVPRDGNTSAHYTEDFDNAAAYRPRIEGLPSVIRAGESVVVKVIQPALPPQRATRPTHWDADRNYDLYDLSVSFTGPDLEKTAKVGAVFYVPVAGWNWGQ